MERTKLEQEIENTQKRIILLETIKKTLILKLIFSKKRKINLGKIKKAHPNLKS